MLRSVSQSGSQEAEGGVLRSVSKPRTQQLVYARVPFSQVVISLCVGFRLSVAVGEDREAFQVNTDKQICHHNRLARQIPQRTASLTY